MDQFEDDPYDVDIVDDFDADMDEDYEDEENFTEDKDIEDVDDDDDILEDDDLDEDDMTQYQEILDNALDMKTGKNPYKTGRFLYKYELARIVSTRAAAIQNGAPPLINLEQDPNRPLRDPLEIAEEELRQNKLPLIVERPLPSKIPHKPIYEQRPLNTLVFTQDFN